MPFLTLTSAATDSNTTGLPILVRLDDVRVLEAQVRQVFEDGEWKPSNLHATLITLLNGTTYLVAESVTDILKQLENPRP